MLRSKMEDGKSKKMLQEDQGMNKCQSSSRNEERKVPERDASKATLLITPLLLKASKQASNHSLTSSVRRMTREERVR